nr:type II toxin-antitoxin system Phd/YefM family antitoxin [uncultured Rhodopila sp.]
MTTWQAANARHKFSDIIDAAVAGQHQFVQRRDGREVVVVSREYFDSTKANLKTFLLNKGYSGAGEAQFDAILAGVRSDAPDFLRRRETDD